MGMGSVFQAITDAEIIEPNGTPIIRFDKIGEIIVDNGSVWWPLLRRQPCILRPGTFELVLQAWTVGPAVDVPEMLEQTSRSLRIVRSPPLLPRLS